MKLQSFEKVQAVRGAVRVLVLGALLAVGLAQSARATTLYAYTGNPYTSCAGTYTCNGTTPALSLTFDTTLTGAALDNLVFGTVGGGDLTAYVTSFSFTDGTGFSLTQANAEGLYAFDVSTDASGNITSWSMSASPQDAPPYLDAVTLSPGVNPYYPQGHDLTLETCCDGFSYIGYGEEYSDPGTWAQPVATPEPSTPFLLLVTGLGLGTMFLRRKQMA